MNPYDLLLKLRDNRILFSYMETSAVYIEDDAWTITGDSADGELRITLTESNTLRFAIPVSFPSTVPVNVLESLLSKLEQDFDGILKGEIDSTFGDLVLYYYIHIGLSDLDTYLDASLIRFKQDKRAMQSNFAELSRTMKKFNQAFSGSSMGSSNPNSSFKPKDSIWDSISDLDKEMSKEDSKKEDEDDRDNLGPWDNNDDSNLS